MSTTPLDLPPLPMAPESMEPGKLYIWHIMDSRHAVVRLHKSRHDDRPALETLHDADVWYFGDKLIGTLHGPIALA